MSNLKEVAKNGGENVNFSTFQARLMYLQLRNEGMDSTKAQTAVEDIMLSKMLREETGRFSSGNISGMDDVSVTPWPQDGGKLKAGVRRITNNRAGSHSGRALKEAIRDSFSGGTTTQVALAAWKQQIDTLEKPVAEWIKACKKQNQ